MMDGYLDKLKESGRLSSSILVNNQISDENAKLTQLKGELKDLKKRRDEALSSGKIKKDSEDWRAMQDAINDVSKSIVETQTNLKTLNQTLKEITWDRWEKTHDAIAAVNNELEFLRGLINEDEMFEKNGNITEKGMEAYGLLAAQYDMYYAEAQKYADERAKTQKQLDEDPFNQNLVDKVKELTEAQQDAINSAHKMKDSMVDVAENGIKKQIDYVKELIDKYTELLDAQKDQTDYAKKVADSQKEINKLEKQYRAIANDNSEEGQTKRQKLRDQLEQAKQSLQDTQEERRISETKEILSQFEKSFEDFLNEKLKDIEGVVQNGINIANANAMTINDTIATSVFDEGYYLSSTVSDLFADAESSRTNIAEYFKGGFGEYKKNFDQVGNTISSIKDGINKIISYYDKAQESSEAIATKDTTGSSIYNGKYFNDEGIADTAKNGLITENGKTYYFKNGVAQKGWQTVSGSKYYFNDKGEATTGFKTISGKKYYFDSTGKQWTKSGFHAIGNDKYYFNSDGTVSTQTGWLTVDGKKYYLSGGKAYKNSWHTENGKKYYFDANGYMVTGTKHIGGRGYIFDKNGVLNQKRTTDLQNKETKALNNAKDALHKAQTEYNNAQAILNKNPKNKTAQANLDKAEVKLKQAQAKLNSLKQYAKGVSFSPKNQFAWTNENGKSEAIIRKSDGAILTPLNKGDSVIPSSAMKNMYQALTDPAKYLKQYMTPDIKVTQSNTSSGSQSPTYNVQFIANGVQDATKFVNDLMNNKKLEKWIQEVTLGQANGNNSYKKYSYAIR